MLGHYYRNIMRCFGNCLRCLWQRIIGPPRKGYRILKSEDEDVESNRRSQRELDELNSEIKTNEQISQLEAELKFLQTQIDNLKKEKSGIQTEKNDALRRLSVVMSSKLRDNNPNIVDLSDEFRPTKLAEMSSELYDNEWTEAFTFLERGLAAESDDESGDRKIIHVLLGIFKDVYTVCKLKHEKEWTDLLKIVIGSTEFAGKEEDVKYLKDLSKKYAISRLEDANLDCLKKLRYLTQIDPCFFNDKSLVDYIKGCVKLSWFAQFQDPPIVFIFPNTGDVVGETFERPGVPETTERDGQFSALISETDHRKSHISTIDKSKVENIVAFDKNLYKEYTKTGLYIDYVVWPIILLHENGSILGKGVAQGCN